MSFMDNLTVALIDLVAIMERVEIQYIYIYIDSLSSPFSYPLSTRNLGDSVATMK
jgi:hypothetical protein